MYKLFIFLAAVAAVTARPDLWGYGPNPYGRVFYSNGINPIPLRAQLVQTQSWVQPQISAPISLRNIYDDNIGILPGPQLVYRVRSQPALNRGMSLDKSLVNQPQIILSRPSQARMWNIAQQQQVWLQEPPQAPILWRPPPQQIRQQREIEISQEPPGAQVSQRDVQVAAQEKQSLLEAQNAHRAINEAILQQQQQPQLIAAASQQQRESQAATQQQREAQAAAQQQRESQAATQQQREAQAAAQQQREIHLVLQQQSDTQRGSKEQQQQQRREVRIASQPQKEVQIASEVQQTRRERVNDQGTKN